MLVLVISTALWRLLLNLFCAKIIQPILSPKGNWNTFSIHIFYATWLFHLPPARTLPNTLLPHFQKQFTVSENIDAIDFYALSVDSPVVGINAVHNSTSSYSLIKPSTACWFGIPAILYELSSRRNFHRRLVVVECTHSNSIDCIITYLRSSVSLQQSFCYILITLNKGNDATLATLFSLVLEYFWSFLYNLKS